MNKKLGLGLGLGVIGHQIGYEFMKKGKCGNVKSNFEKNRKNVGA